MSFILDTQSSLWWPAVNLADLGADACNESMAIMIGHHIYQPVYDDRQKTVL